MTEYICKCGRIVNKSTNADNTGNRDTDGCDGCPYLLPWGPFQWDETRHAMVTEIKGYECRMSPTLNYATYYQGSDADKCVLHIYSLDYDFLERVAAWTAEHFPDKEISCNFSRDRIRAVEFIGGLYRMSVYPVQNKKGIAAKAALLEHFFDGNGARKDMTPDEEKACILASIEDGKARAQKKEEKSLTYRDPSTGWLYRVSPEPFQGSYFVQYLDPKSSVIWKRCSGAVLCAGSLKKEVEEEYLRLNAKRSGWEPVVGDSDANPTSPVVVIAAAKETVAAPEVSGLDSMTAEDAASSNELPEVATENALAGTDGSTMFDYSGLDAAAVDSLRIAEKIIRTARQKYIVDLAGAVSMAHKELVRISDEHNNQHTEDTFIAWCRFMGISKTTAYQLLQVQSLISSSTPEEQAVLEAASPSLLYAAAKPSAPTELVQAVKDGDITTHKQYQDALAEIRARDAKIQELMEVSEDAARRADEARAWAKKVEQDAALASKREEEARAAAHKYHVRVEEVEAQRNALLDQQTEYIDRIHELESRPVEVAVQEPTEEQIAAAAKQRTKMVEAQLKSVQEQLDDALDRVSGYENNAYMAAAAFASNAAMTINSIRTTFWALAAELPDEDFADALAPLDEAVCRIYNREWEDEEE